MGISPEPGSQEEEAAEQSIDEYFVAAFPTHPMGLSSKTGEQALRAFQAPVPEIKLYEKAGWAGRVQAHCNTCK